LSSLIEPGRQAQGCLQFSLQHSQVDPDVWLVSGFWSSEQAMSAYFSSPALMLFTELLNDMVVRSMDFQTFTDASAANAYGEYLQLAG
jgi:quinol monooxygenase YgiN